MLSITALQNAFAQGRSEGGTRFKMASLKGYHLDEKKYPGGRPGIPRLPANGGPAKLLPLKSSVSNSECRTLPGNHTETGPIFTGLEQIVHALTGSLSTPISLPLLASTGFGNCLPDHLEYISQFCCSWSLFRFDETVGLHRFSFGQHFAVLFSSILLSHKSGQQAAMV